MRPARLNVTPVAVIGLGMLRPLDAVPPAQLEEAARQWGRGNLVRVGLLAVVTVSALRGLLRASSTAANPSVAAA